MAVDDFCGLCPDEFEAICQAYGDQRETQYKDGWERTRAVTVATIRPHIKGQKSTTELFPLPWDRDREKGRKAEITSKEDSKKRLGDILRRTR